MNKQELIIIKIGGNVIDNDKMLDEFLTKVASIHQPKILIHGGGKLATQLSVKLGVETKMIDGRRITDTETIKIVTMVYAGLVNKTIVAKLQSNKCNAIGLCGADAQLMVAHKRQHPTIDFGFVGDIDSINASFLSELLKSNHTPILAPISMSKDGLLLNTNADTIASSVAVALSKDFKVKLFYCFEKNGLLKDINDENSIINSIKISEIQQLIEDKTIIDGMIPKVQNIKQAIENGVDSVTLCHASNLLDLINENSKFGTTFKN